MRFIILQMLSGGAINGKPNKNLALRSQQARTYSRTLGMDVW